MIVPAPLNREYISVLIPTINRGSIKTVLTNLCASDRVGEVIISDAGEISIMSDIDNIVLLDLLRRQGITVKVIREEQKGIGKTRYSLMQEANYKIALMIDDDILLTNESLNALYNLLNASNMPYTVPCCHIVTDFLGVKGLDRSPVTWEYALKVANGKDWLLPYFNYVPDHRDISLKIKFCGTQAIMFLVEEGLKAVELQRWKKGFNREDIYFTKTMGEGFLLTFEICWHLQHNLQWREWMNYDEAIGYQNILDGNLEAYLE